MYVCFYACIYVCMYACMHTYMCINTYIMRECMNTRIACTNRDQIVSTYIDACICMYTCICIYSCTSKHHEHVYVCMYAMYVSWTHTHVQEWHANNKQTVSTHVETYIHVESHQRWHTLFLSVVKKVIVIKKIISLYTLRVWDPYLVNEFPGRHLPGGWFCRNKLVWVWVWVWVWHVETDICTCAPKTCLSRSSVHMHTWHMLTCSVVDLGERPSKTTKNMLVSI